MSASYYVYKDLYKETKEMCNKIVMEQNLRLIKEIAYDYNINYNVMKMRYERGDYLNKFS